MTAKVIDFVAYRLRRNLVKLDAAYDELVTVNEDPPAEFEDISEEELRMFFNALQSCWRD